MRIDLIWIAGRDAGPTWSLGQTLVAMATPVAVAAAAAAVAPEAEFVLFWDAALGAPDAASVLAAAQTPGDVFHAGLALGMGGLPHLIDYADPVWRFNRDPDPALGRDAPAGPTSWRLSLRACLVRAAVLRRLGGPDGVFETLAGASLELGHRWIARGAMMRHAPGLLSGSIAQDSYPVARTQDKNPVPYVTLADEFRFVHLRYGRMWAGWAWWRALRHSAPTVAATSAWRRGAQGRRGAGGRGRAATDQQPTTNDQRPALPPATVSVLIPTLDRYPHLFNLLDQLRGQTVPPLEVIVVDQTDMAVRDTTWPERFTDLPLRVLWRDVAGQCSSRNAGLACVRGEAVLFLDDDDEILPELIEQHLMFLAGFGVDASCGVAEELGAGALPAEFRLIRDSDVFPTNNSLLRVAALRDSGLFDLAYERGERADADFGMRLYLAGKQLALNPAASVVHLHAPRGGLRQHRARVVTRAAGRGGFRRHLLAPTEGYLWQRYFTPAQVHEALLIRTVGTLRGSERGLRRLLRAAVMLALLPDTWRQNRARLTQGRALLRDYPSIPVFNPAPPQNPVEEPTSAAATALVGADRRVGRPSHNEELSPA